MIDLRRCDVRWLPSFRESNESALKSPDCLPCNIAAISMTLRPFTVDGRARRTFTNRTHQNTHNDELGSFKTASQASTHSLDCRMPDRECTHRLASIRLLLEQPSCDTSLESSIRLCRHLTTSTPDTHTQDGVDIDQSRRPRTAGSRIHRLIVGSSRKIRRSPSPKHGIDLLETSCRPLIFACVPRLPYHAEHFTPVKAAIVLFNISQTKQPRAVFLPTEAGRKWPFMESWVAS
jgi:hypothetical protein